jgi:hypothetical protein
MNEQEPIAIGCDATQAELCSISFVYLLSPILFAILSPVTNLDSHRFHGFTLKKISENLWHL